MVFRDIDKKALIDNAATVSSKITIVGTDITFTEDDFISEWDYEDYRYVPENGFIGQFVERIFDGKLKDLPNDINIENKEINLQIGINNGITGETTYYDYGNFIVTKIGEQDTTGISTFESADYAKKFNAEYVDSLTYPCLALELANSACEQAGVELATKGYAYCYAVPKEGLVAGTYRFLIDNTSYEFVISENLNFYDSIMYIVDENKMVLKRVNEDFSITRTDLDYKLTTSSTSTDLKVRKIGYYDFINNDFVIENNQFESTDTLREVIKSVAKLAYTWVRVGTDNKVYLDFKKKTSSSYGLTINGKSYQETSTQSANILDLTKLDYSNTNLVGFTINDLKTNEIKFTIDANNDWRTVVMPLTFKENGKYTYTFQASEDCGTNIDSYGRIYGYIGIVEYLKGTTTVNKKYENSNLGKTKDLYFKDFDVDTSLYDYALAFYPTCATTTTEPITFHWENLGILKGGDTYNHTYVDFTPNSPSPEYPSEIQNVEGITNIFDGEMEEGGYNGSNGSKQANSNLVRNKKPIYVEPNTKYITSNNGVGIGINIYEYDKDGNYIGYLTGNSIPANTPFATSSNTAYINIGRSKSDYDKIQIEPGSTIHPHSPYGRWLEVKSIGKNMSDLSSFKETTVNGVTLIPKRNNTFTLKGTSTGHSNHNIGYKIPQEWLGKTLTLSVNENFEGNVGFKGKNVSGNIFVVNTVNSKSKTLTITQEIIDKIYVFDIYASSSFTGEVTFSIQLEEGSTATPYEPYKETTALIDLNKKNLFDKDKFIQGTWGNGNELLRVVAFGELYSKGTSVTIKNLNTTKYKFAVGFSALNTQSGNTGINESGWVTNDSYTITAINDSYLWLQVSKLDNSNITPSELLETDFKIYEGIETDDYYRLASIGDIKDTFKDGVLTQRIVKKVLNGSESGWYKHTVTTNNLFILPTDDGIGYDYNVDKISPICCTHYNALNLLKDSTDTGETVGIAIIHNGQIRVFDGINGCSTTNEFKQWLSENPIEVEYVLKTPIEHNLRYQTLELFDDVNNISFNDDLITEDDYLFVEDKITIDDYYETEKQPELYGPVNKVLLGMSTVDGENAYKAKLVDEIESISIDGKSHQETSTQGKNMLDLTKLPISGSTSVITISDLEPNKITMFTPNGALSWQNLKFDITPLLKPNTTYTINYKVASDSGKPNDGSDNRYTIFGMHKINKETSATTKVLECPSYNTTNYANGQFTTADDLDTENYYLRLWGSLSQDLTADVTLKLEDLYLAEETSFSGYVDFTPNSPSPEYPSEIKNVEGVTNLFNGVTTNELVNDSGTISNNNAWSLSDYIEVEPNEVYTFSRQLGTGQSFIIAEYDENKTFIKRNVQGSSSSLYPYTITTSATTKYVRLNYNNTHNGDLFAFIKGTNTDYVPYGRWLEVKSVGKNLFNENEYVENVQTSNYSEYNGKKCIQIYAVKHTMFEDFKPNTQYVISYEILDKSSEEIAGIVIRYDDGTEESDYNLNIGEKTFVTKLNKSVRDIYFNGWSSGRYVMIANIQVVEGSTATPYELYKESTALIDFNKKNHINIDDLLNANSEVYNGSTFSNMLNLTLEPNTQYVLFSNVTGTSTGPATDRCLYKCENNETIAIFKDNEYKFTTDNTGEIKIGFINNRTYSSEITNKTSFIKLYEGVETDDYYRLASIGDIKDTFENGVLTQRIGKVVLYGSDDENWSFQSKPSATSSVIGKFFGNKAGNYNYYSSHFIYNSQSENRIVLQDSFLYLRIENSIVGITDTDTNADIVDKMKTWLSNNPIEVEYILATPIEHTLNYEVLELHEGYNNITTNDELEPKMNISISDIDDNVTTYSGNAITTILSDNKETSLQIWDNPLTYTEDLRKIALNGSESLFGVRYTPMTTQTVGHPWLEASDCVKLTNLSNQTLYTYPLDRKLSYKGYIKSDISSKAPTLTEQKYEFNGDTDTRLKKTQISVDKANQKITAVASDISDTNEKVSQLTITTGEIKTEVSQKATKTELSNTKTELNNNINNAVDNIEVGGRNLILNSNFDKGMNQPARDAINKISGWSTPISNSEISDDVKFNNHSTLYRHRTGTTAVSWTENQYYYYRPDNEKSVDTNYVLTFWVYATNIDWVNSTNTIASAIRLRDANNAAIGEVSIRDIRPTKANEWQKVECKFTIEASKNCDWFYIFDSPSRDFDYYLADYKLEIGNKSTDWTPAPEDVDSNIDKAKNDAINSANTATDNKLKNYSTTTQMNSAITQKADSILSTVSTTYTTKTESTNNINAAKQAAIDSANTSTDNKLKNYSTTTEMNSAIDQKADSITSTVSATYITKTDSANNISNAINNIAIGGDNLARGTQEFTLDIKDPDNNDDTERIDGFLITNGVTIEDNDDDAIFKKASMSATGLTNISIKSAYSNYIDIGLVKDKDVVVSFDIMVDDVDAWDHKYPFIWEYYDSSNTRIGYNDIPITDSRLNINSLESGVWTRLEFKRKVDSNKVAFTTGNTMDNVTSMGIRLTLFKNGSIHFRKLKVEVGNKSSGWSPSMYDPDVEITELKQKVTTLEQTSNGFSITISELNTFKTDTNDALKGIGDDIKDVNTELDKKQSAEDVSKAMETRLEEGVDKVITKTGYSFTQDGLVVSKTGSEMSTVIDEDGMTIIRSGNEVLVADHDGVVAYNLHANTYLLVGTNSRFENYTNDNGEARTGCFWIG